MNVGHTLIDVTGTELTAEEREIVRHPAVAGIILFSRNFESINQLKDLIKEIKKAKHPLIIATDQEGGRVQRFREGFTNLPHMQNWGKAFNDDPDEAVDSLYKIIFTVTKELLSVGVNVNLAPVLDMDNDLSDVIKQRGLSSKPLVVARLASTLIKAMHDAGMPAMGKHFPGHGSVEHDSHKTLPVDDRPLKTIYDHDLIPFIKLIGELDAIMPAHVVYSNVDTKPACFSRHWLQEILRNKLGFEGVVLSDDLSMEAAAHIGSYSQRAEEALDAGCDLLSVCNNRKGAIEVLEFIENYHHSESAHRIKNYISLLP